MAFEFDFNETFKYAALYLSKGLRVVRLHGIWPDGSCTCRDPECYIGGSLEKRVGKHPVELTWGDSWARTEDDILAWDDGTPCNIGVVLGPHGGMVDIEDDTVEGKAFRESLGMADLVTPTWTSGKSTHQLLGWDDRLSTCKGKAEPGGLECRLGAGEAQIQSVMPPSWHRTGVKYKWKEGLSIDDVEIAPIPTALVKECVRYSTASGYKESVNKGPLCYRKVKDGEGRHKSLLYWAWSKIINEQDPLRPDRRAVIMQEVLDANQLHIDPPKTRDEVVKIVNSCFEHYRKKNEGGWRPVGKDFSEDGVKSEAESVGTNVKPAAAVAVSGYESHGLERYQVGSVEAYKTGDWSIQIIHSDPPEIVLSVPAWESTPCRGRITMSFPTFKSAAKVADAIFLATRRVMLDADKTKWRGIWCGIDASRKTDGESVPGLSQLLMAKKSLEDDIYVGASSLRYAQLAGMLLKILRKAMSADEDKPEPSENGKARWVTPEECWFQWAVVWDEIGRNSDVMPGERNRIRSRILQIVEKKDFVHRRWRFGSLRPEYVVFTEEWIQAVERLASADQTLENPHQAGEVDGQLAEKP